MVKAKHLVRILIVLAFVALLAVPTAAQEPVKIATGWGGAELAAFVEVLEGSGIDYEILSLSSIEVDLGPLVAAGNAPDIAQMPRPGVTASFARDGALIPLSGGDDPFLSDEVLANTPNSILEIGTVDGELYGLMVKVSSKGTFWYKPASLAALGMEAPTTYEELIALGDAYVANGQVPFMVTAGSAWVLTDWFETLYVSVAGSEMYQGLFVTHTVEWTDPTVVETLELFRQIFDPADERISGGVDGALSTDLRSGIDAAFRPEDPAGELFLSGSFVGGIISETFPDLICGEDFDWFDFPEPGDMHGDTLMGGGDVMMVFNDRPEVRAMMHWLASPESATIWATAEQGAILSPNTGVPLESYDACKAKEAQQIGATDVFVFDGSDLAPGAVGGDAMFIALQDYLADPDSMMEILETLEDAADAAY
jgi:ABC-type glycerol-3-phosphate transport system substrate-binding protein